MKRFMVLLVLVMSFSSLFAGTWLAQDTKIIGVSSTTTSGTSGKFWIQVSGGTINASCSSGKLYYEISTSNLDADTFKRVYAMALTAMTTGKTANVYQYTSADGTCYAQALDIEN